MTAYAMWAPPGSVWSHLSCAERNRWTSFARSSPAFRRTAVMEVDGHGL
jgi:hypothetical protein